MKFEEFIELVPKIQSADLPGKSSHQEIMDIDIRNRIFQNINHPTPPKESSVLCLIYPDEYRQSKLVFILRKRNNSHHSGQIGFPGGKKEDQDLSDYETALREAEEEVGVNKEKISLVKKLSRVFIPVSNYKVQSFLAFTEEKPLFVKQDEEVEKILEFKLEDFLLLPKVEIKKTYFDKDYTLYAFQTGKWLIWGATAMILSEIVQLIHQAKKA